MIEDKTMPKYYFNIDYDVIDRMVCACEVVSLCFCGNVSQL